MTAGGKVKIQSISLTGADGQVYSFVLYMPKSATSENPAPVFATYHGNSGIARNQEAWCLELSRRGFICITSEVGGGGESTITTDKNAGSTHASAALEYVLSLKNADPTRLVTAGHSNGSVRAGAMAKQYNAIGVIFASMSGNTNKGWQGNVLCIQGWEDRLDNLEKVKGKALKDFQNIGHTELTEVVPEKQYGSYETNDYGLLHMVEKCVHEGPLFSKDAIKYIINFSQDIVGKETINAIDGSNQVWFWRDVVSVFAMIAFVATMLTFTGMMMESVPFFSKLKQPMPRNIGLRGPGLIISIVAAVVFPLIVLYTGAFGISNALGTNSVSIFAMQHSNRIFSAVVGINLLGIVMLVVYHFTEGRKNKATLRDYGLTYEGKKGLSLDLIGRAFILAVLTLVVMFTFLRWQEKYLGTTYYCWLFGMKPASLKFVFTRYLAYIICWIICFIIAAIGLNVERRLPSTGSETKDAIIQTAFNILCSGFTITIIVIVHFAVQYKIGGGTNALNSFGIPITRLFCMPIGMVIAGAGQTYCYRKSGSIWLGVFLMGIFCALNCMTFGQYKVMI